MSQAHNFPRHRKEDAEHYLKNKWWLGLTLVDIFDRAADVYPYKEAVVDQEVRLTFAELRKEVDTLAAALMHVGLERGDTVLLQIPNWHEFVCLFFALQKIGCIPVLLIATMKQLEVSHVCSVCEAKAWIVPMSWRKMDYTAFIPAVKNKNPQLKYVIGVRVTDRASVFTNTFEELASYEIKPTDFKLLNQRKPHATDVAHILPSGGTTGLPKAIPRTHNDYICNVEFLHKRGEMSPTDVALLAVPVGHNLALLNVVGAMLFGYKLVLLDSTRPDDICGTIEKERITYMPSVPSLLRRIIEMPEVDKYNFSSLKKVSAGGQPSTPDLVREVANKLGCIYINEFGMSEGLLCRTRLEEAVEVICQSVGTPCCPYDEVKVVDESGNEVLHNVDGELSVKGPGIFAGYWKNTRENEKSFTVDGYFRTGDLARRDETGNIKITGRIKDIIIRGGENISAPQVEGLLCSHPEIVDAAVIGMPDKELGERVCAYVRLMRGSKLNENEIRQYLEKIGASKLLIPERFEFVSQIPLTPAGKHDKKLLREDIKRKLGLVDKN